MRGVWAIAVTEARRYLPFLRPRLGVSVIVVGVLLGIGWTVVEERGLDPERGLYVVEVEGEPALLGVLQESSRFRLVPGDGGLFATGAADLFVTATGDVHADLQREKSRAAWHELDRAARAWLDARLSTEGAEDAAFPVRVAIDYEPRTVVGGSDAGGDGDSDAGPGGAAGMVGANLSDDAPGPNATDGSADAAERTSDAEVGLRPDEIEPPFPIRSLLLTFAYLIPVNFVAQLYAGAMLNVRLRRRGLLLLATPHARGAVLLGLSLPYLAGTLAIAVLVTVFIGAGWLGFGAVVPVLVVMLAAALLSGLVARSQREMTFLLVTVSTGLATYLFLPAMFVQVHPIAFLSPMAVVSAAVRAEPVSLGAFLYATTPLAFGAVALVALSVAVFKAEHLFTPAGLVARFFDGLGDALAGPWRLFSAGLLAVPFALALEFMLLVVAVMLELRVAFLVFLFGAAFVEELLKGVAVYAHRSRRDRPLPAWLSGVCVGGAFFLGEKVALLAAIAGFGLLPFGSTALATFGVGSPLLLVAPLVLHMTTATVSAAFARRGRSGPLIGVWLATLLHVGYNASLVLGGWAA